MILYHDCATFKVLGITIHLYSEKMAYGYSTVAEIDNTFHYIGNELPNITSAIFVWEELYSRSLTQEELRQVLKDNNIL